jgi:hypothetical protein
MHEWLDALGWEEAEKEDNSADPSPLVYFILRMKHLRARNTSQRKCSLNGWCVRFMHGRQPDGLTAFLYMFSVLFLKSYRKLRKVTWVNGVLLLFSVLAFGFSGYLSRAGHDSGQRRHARFFVRESSASARKSRLYILAWMNVPAATARPV